MAKGKEVMSARAVADIFEQFTEVNAKFFADEKILSLSRGEVEEHIFTLKDEGVEIASYLPVREVDFTELVTVDKKVMKRVEKLLKAHSYGQRPAVEIGSLKFRLPECWKFKDIIERKVSVTASDFFWDRIMLYFADLRFCAGEFGNGAIQLRGDTELYINTDWVYVRTQTCSQGLREIVEEGMWEAVNRVWPDLEMKKEEALRFLSSIHAVVKWERKR